MKKYLKQLFITACLIGVLIFPYFVFANNPAISVLEQLEGKSGYQEADEKTISEIASVAIKAFLSLLGIIFLVLIVYGGYTYMTAQGEQEKVEKALSTIRRAIIGLVIVASAYAITYFVFTSLSGGGGGGFNTI